MVIFLVQLTNRLSINMTHKYIQIIAYQVVEDSWRAADLIFGNVSSVAMLVCNYIVIQRDLKLRKNVFVSTSSAYFVSGDVTNLNVLECNMVMLLESSSIIIK